MNQKGFINSALIVLLIALAGTLSYIALTRKDPVSTPVPSQEPSPTPTPSSAPSPKPTKDNNFMSFSLGEQFTLKKNQIARIANTGLEIEITAFYNDPCKEVCVWSGVGILFEYRFNGETREGINLTRAFGYQTTIVQTDHETYADLIIHKE